MIRATKVKNLLVSLRTSYFLKGAVTFSSHRIYIIRRICQIILLKRAKIYHLYHCFHLLLNQTSESTTTPVSICVVSVRPHQYQCIILESGKMFLNNLLYSKGECVQPENEKKAVHLLLLFGLSLQSLSLLQNWLTFFVQDAHIPYALRCTYVY